MVETPPSAHRWKINQEWTTIRIFSACKRNEILTQATAWRKPEDIMLSALSQLQKLPFMWGTYHHQIHRNRKENGGCWGLRRGADEELLFNGCSLRFARWKHTGGCCTAVWTYFTPLSCTLGDGWEGKLYGIFFTTVKTNKQNGLKRQTQMIRKRQCQRKGKRKEQGSV